MHIPGSFGYSLLTHDSSLTHILLFACLPHHLSVVGDKYNMYSLPKWFELIALIVVRHEDSFVDLVRCDPKGRWTDENPHPFCQCLDEAYHLAEVSPEERAAWKKELKLFYRT